MPGHRRVAIVTGASRGIGKQCAIALAERGFDVVVSSRAMKSGEVYDVSQTTKRADFRPLPGGILETAEEVEKLGQKALAVQVDLLEKADMDNLVQRSLEEFGRIDAFVSNARWDGPGYMDPFLDTPFQVYADSFAINSLAPIYLTKLIAPVMADQGGGVIVNITSGTATRESAAMPTGDWMGAPGLAYGSSKAGMHRIVVGLAKELRQRRIAAVNMSPGAVYVERKSVQREGSDFTPESQIPPEAVGRACAFVCDFPDPMFFSGLLIFAPQFAIEHGLIEQERIPGSAGPGAYGSPGRLLSEGQV